MSLFQLWEPIAWKDDEVACRPSLKSSRTRQPLALQPAWSQHSWGPTSAQILALGNGIIPRWEAKSIHFSVLWESLIAHLGICLNNSAFYNFSMMRQRSVQTRRRMLMTSDCFMTYSRPHWKSSGSGQKTSLVSLSSAQKIRSCCLNLHLLNSSSCVLHIGKCSFLQSL